MSLKVDLNKLKTKKEVVYDTVTCKSLKIGDHVLTSDDKGSLLLLKDEGSSKDPEAQGANLVVAEFKNNDMFINGKSVELIWQTLENHYEALRKVFNESVS